MNLKTSLIIATASLLQIAGFIFIIMKGSGIEFKIITPLMVAIGGTAAIMKWWWLEKTKTPAAFMGLTRVAAAAGFGLIIVAMFL